MADGRKTNAPYVGPLKVTFGNRLCYVGALVLGDEVLLGAVPMEDMDLVVNPGRREVTVDPASPNFAHSRVKRATNAVWAAPPTARCCSRSTAARSPLGIASTVRHSPGNTRL